MPHGAVLSGRPATCRGQRLSLSSFNNWRIWPTPLWARAKIGTRKPAVCEALCEAAAVYVQDSNAHVDADTLWATAKAGIHARAMFEALCEAATEDVQDFHAPYLANTSLDHGEDRHTPACCAQGALRRSC